MKISLSKVFIVLILLSTSRMASAQFELITDVIVSDQSSMISVLGEYVMSGESKAKSTTLLRRLHDGDNPSTHTIVSVFESLEDMEASIESRAKSKQWFKFVKAAHDFSKTNGSYLSIQRLAWGDSLWQQDGYVVSMTLNAGNDKDYLAAMDDWKAANNVKNKGMIRIQKLRGNAATHAVIIAAPSYVDLINTLENIEASEAFAKMKAVTNTTLVGTEFFSVLKLWKL